MYGTVYGYTAQYGNTAYSRIYTVLDRIYGKIRYGVRYGPNFESLSQKIRIAALFQLCKWLSKPTLFRRPLLPRAGKQEGGKLSG